MTTELSALFVANAASLIAISAALSILGLVGLALFTAEAGGREMPHWDEEQGGFGAEHSSAPTALAGEVITSTPMGD
jgi:hypothetical protein